MPVIPDSATASCYYRLEGVPGRPVLVLSHSLGLDHGMWDAQTADLLPHYQVLRYDTRGHGASSVAAGDYSIAELAQDVLALADACGVARFAFCGLSLGGMIGQWLGAHAPDRLTHLVLANTSSRLTDPQPMEARRRAVLEHGMAAVEELVMGRFFSPAVLASASPQVATARETLLSTNPIGYAGCCAAVRDMNQTELLARITVPTLVISGDLDVGMPWDAHAAVLARDIAGARVVRLPAAHISNIERPRSFNAALLDFLVPPADGSSRGRLRRAARGPRRRLRRPRDCQHDRFHPRFPGPHHELSLGSDLDPARPRSPHPPAARADHHGRARPVGGVSPPRPHRSRARARTVRSGGSPSAGRRLRRRAGGQRRVPRRVRSARREARTDIPESIDRTAWSLVYDCHQPFCDRRN